MPRGGSFVAADPGAARAELARFYDLDMEGQREDVELYLALAGRGRLSILELACGTGRVAIPLATAGHDVVGVDHDPAALERGRRSGRPAKGRLDLVEADITALDLRRRFDLVILGLNTLLMLGSRQAQASALESAARHLNDQGRLVIDVWLPSAHDLAAYDGRVELAWQKTDPDNGDQVSKLWSADYDAATATATITTWFDSWPAAGGPVHRVSRRDEMLLLGASQLTAMVEAVGVRVDRLAGDYSMVGFGPGSDRVILIGSLL